MLMETLSGSEWRNWACCDCICLMNVEVSGLYIFCSEWFVYLLL